MVKAKKILVLRIAGRAAKKKKAVETMDRLKIRKKFTCIIVDSTDKARMGMVEAVKDSVSFGEVSEEFIAEMKKKREEKNGVFFLHPPVGGFKKSSKVAAPKGILGRQSDITKLVGRML